MCWLKNALRKITRRHLLVAGGLLLSPESPAQQASVLATGDWFKLGIVSTGIYKIDNACLETLGIATDGLNPRLLQLYGNGGHVLPQDNQVPGPDDLIQNAIYVAGEQDGKWDPSDALYFYAEAPARIKADPATGSLSHETNPYSDTTFYFLTVGRTPGLRITPMASGIPSEPVVSAFDSYWYHEREATNLLHSGREWWGNYFSGGNQPTIEPGIPGVLPQSQAVLRTSAIVTAQVNTRLSWRVNGTAVGEQQAGTVSTNRYDLKAQYLSADYSFTTGNTPPEVFVIGAHFDQNGQPGAYGYQNFVGLQTRRELTQYESSTVYRFFSTSPTATTYEFTRVFPEFQLWHVSNPLQPERVALTSEAGGSRARFSAEHAGGLQTYIGFQASEALPPASARKIRNQNLRGKPVPDMLLITAPAWKTEAERLAQFRSENDRLDVLVATTDEVYNEFASGQPDISAIRDLCRFFFRQDSVKFRYLLLFGDATYDFRNKTLTQSSGQRASWVPTYQSRESLHPVYTYSSDDYFGFLSDGTGNWEESPAGDHLLEIGIGRLPVKSIQEARVVVDKLIQYASPAGRGNWRNRITLVADNGDGNIHQEHADFLATLTEPGFVPARVFLDEFPLAPEDPKVPEVNKKIRDAVRDGTLVLNFTGHGDASGWTSEKVLTLSEIQALRGYNNMPLLLTATCEFGRYDDPALVSGAELMLLSPRGAAIGAMTTTRPVYASTNFSLNSAFYTALLSWPGRLGDIIRVTKNKSLSGSLNRNFVLLGDPSMRLALPQYPVRWQGLPDTLSALQPVTLSGAIMDGETILTRFNGKARVTVFDQSVTFQTLGAEGAPATYSEFRDRLFEGEVTVTNGVFTVTFVVPAFINPAAGTSKVSIYAWETDGDGDAAGQLLLQTGGVPSAPVQDRIPPAIHAYLNDPSFQNGESVNSSPVLKIEFSDENGISLSGSGCAPTALLNDTLEIALGAYYTAVTDDYRKGTVSLPLEVLPQGSHQLKIQVCDVAGNRTEALLLFTVGKSLGISVHTAIVYPNPFQDQLMYRIGHSREGDDIDVQFRLYARTGRLLQETDHRYYNSPGSIEETLTIAPFTTTPELQIYLFELTVRSLQDLTERKISGKLVRN